MCGPGLYCLQHVCNICEEGVYDPSDGKMCFNGHWHDTHQGVNKQRLMPGASLAQDLFAVGNDEFKS